MNKYSKFFAIVNKIGMTKEEAVSQFTEGRTRSLRDMHKYEYDRMVNDLNGRLKTASPPTPLQMERGELDKKRKRLLSVFHELEATSITYANCTKKHKANIEMIMYHINKYGCVKKEQLNDFTSEELSKLISQFDNILKKYYR